MALRAYNCSLCDSVGHSMLKLQNALILCATILICCHFQTFSTKEISYPSTWRSPKEADSKANSTLLSGRLSNAAKYIVKRSLNECSCGLGKRSRVVGGREVSSSTEHPWMAAVLKTNGGFLCGGTLITRKHVLTANHCVLRIQSHDLKVQLGSRRLTPPDATAVVVSVAKIIHHLSYKASDSQANDIALLELSTSVKISSSILPACIPQQGIRLEDTEATVIGWGDLGNGATSNVLHEAGVSIISNSECQKRYRYETITNAMLCAGHPNGRVDSCQGDSGGPLLWHRRGTWYVVGVISWGYGCGLKGYPGINTRVTHYEDWLRRHTSSSNTCW